MKKLVTALLAAVMVLSMCAVAPAEEKTAEYPWSKYDKVQDVCIWFPVNYDCPDVQMVEDAVNAISVERYGIRYHFVVLSVGQYQTQLNLALTGDDECDAFKNTGMMNTVKNGQVYDMTEFFDNDPNKDSIVEWADRFNKRCRVDGRLYVLQALYEFGDHLSLNITDDVAEFYGIEPMTELSLDDMDELFAKIKADFPDRYPIAGGYGMLFGDFWSWDIAGDSLASGVLPRKGQDDDLKLECIFDCEEYINVLRHAHSWYEKGYVNPDILSNTSTGSFAMLNSHEAACAFDTFGVNNYPGGIRTVTKEVGCWGPSWGGDGYSINSLSKNPEATYRGLTAFWYDPELATILNNGIEGVHYTKNDDGTISYISGDPATAGWSAATMFWVFPGCENSRPIDTNGPTFYDDLNALNSDLFLSKAFGFVYDPEDAYDEWVACRAVISNYYYMLNSGAVDIDSTLAEAKEAWLAAGGERLMADKQAKLDAWLAAQN